MGFREVNIVTSFRYKQSWPVVIRLVDGGVFGDVTQLITHSLPLEKTIEAFEICADRSTNAIKVQVGGRCYSKLTSLDCRLLTHSETYDIVDFEV